MYAKRMFVLIAGAMGIEVPIFIALDDERIFFSIQFQFGFYFLVFRRFDDRLCFTRGSFLLPP